MGDSHFAGAVRRLFTSDDRRVSTTPLAMVLAAFAGATASGCDNERPAIVARFQRITFDEPPVPEMNQKLVNVVARSSSGLPVTYSSLTSSTCSVDQGLGTVTGIASGTCTIQADQFGNTEFAPARPVEQNVTFRLTQEIAFESTLSLGLYDTATARAVASAGTSIQYGTTTPLICSVDRETGLVTAIAVGTCTVTATAGQTQIAQSVIIEAPTTISTPGSPTRVTATSGATPSTVTLRAESTRSGGSPITAYFVASAPVGISATSTSLPVSVTCPSSCAGYAFTLAATNAIGSSPPSRTVDIVTTYAVTAIFHEPDTQPNESIFVGQYVFDTTSGIVSGLAGRLSEAMTGGLSPYPNDTMNWLSVAHQLSAQSVEIDSGSGLLVTTFLLPTTNTLASDPAFGGSDGWAPGDGNGLYFGYPGTNPGNAYVTVFVNTVDPLAPPTAAQIDKLAYADCTPEGMMGATCMTATSVAGYGSIGTMGGYPISQTTVRQ